jgi:hypothetical protein
VPPGTRRRVGRSAASPGMAILLRGSPDGLRLALSRRVVTSASAFGLRCRSGSQAPPMARPRPRAAATPPCDSGVRRSWSLVEIHHDLIAFSGRPGAGSAWPEENRGKPADVWIESPGSPEFASFPASPLMRMFRDDGFPPALPHGNRGRSGNSSGAVIKWHRLADIKRGARP